MVGEEYSNVYTATLKSLARAYCDWKTTSRASTPDLKMEGHPIKDAIFIPKAEFEDTRERDLPPHMARAPSDPVLSQAIS